MVFLNGRLQTPTIDYVIVESVTAMPDFLIEVKEGDVLAIHDFFSYSASYTKHSIAISYWIRTLGDFSGDFWESVL